jgi:ribonuclease D
MERPLPAQLLEYAHADVSSLVRLGRAIMARLERLGRLDWAMDLSHELTDPALYESRPKAIANKLYLGGKIDAASYPLLLALVEWRESRIRELDVPRRWLADDQLLVDLARVRPKDLSHLKSFRGLNKGEITKHGEKIIRILNKPHPVSDPNPPERHRTRPPTQDEARAMDLVKVYVALLSDHHQIAPKHLINSKNLLLLVRERPQTQEALVRGEFMSHGAAAMIGEEIISILRGERALILAEGRGGMRVDTKRVPPTS